MTDRIPHGRGGAVMQCFEFETMCRWIAARLRGMGMDIHERDPFFMDAVSALGVENVAEAVGLGEDEIHRLARRLGHDESEAA